VAIYDSHVRCYLHLVSLPTRKAMTSLTLSVGFWHALYTLDEGNYGVWEIAEYMVNIWFGLDSTGFDISSMFLLSLPHLSSS